MDKSFFIIFLVWIFTTAVFCQYYSPTQTLSKSNIVSASYDTYNNWMDPYCVSRTSGQQYNIWPTGQSMENLISLIERLEIRLENDTDNNLKQHMGAENVVKLLLRRFRFDGFDHKSATYQNPRDYAITEIANAFFNQGNEGTGIDTNYYFPDAFFSQTELCSLYYMLSHNVYNNETQPRAQYSAVSRFHAIGKRQAYNSRQNPQQYPQQYNNQNQRQNPNQFNRQYAPVDTIPVQSESLIKHPVREEGVVSFRGSQDEAIAPARVLIGVLAGLKNADLKRSIKQVVTALNPNLVLQADKDIDPIMALTIADLWGHATGSQDDQKQYYYGVKGQWSSGSCTTHYALTDVKISEYTTTTGFIKATKAELRGGIDGYLIGKNLKDLVISDPKSLRLSTILRSYYSKPKVVKSSSFSVSYCNRDSQMSGQDLSASASAYATIWSKYVLKSDATKELLGEFSPAFEQAKQKENTNGYNDYCTMLPGGNLDSKAPCETPSDVIYIVDATTAQKLRDSSKIVTLIDGNLINIRTEGGKVSIFANSPGQNSINSEINNAMPKGPEQWPLVPMAFNSTNTGFAQCRIDDFINKSTLPPIANTGKYFKFLNQTLFFYEWWNRDTNASAVPAKTAVLIDYDSVTAPPDGNERNDYNYFKDQLRYRHRDVKFLTATTNQELFKDILREDTDKEQAPVNIGNMATIAPLASKFASKICENPAIFQYNKCYERRSDNVQYIGYVTPGYKQNWAMYPEFFLKSFDIYFKFKAEDGDIKVCFDRWFPPQRQDSCKEITNGKEEVFQISNPCKGKDFSSCDPFYFTVWGKDRTATTQCSDARCLSLDQIKFTVTHSGVQCNSSNHLLPSTKFQLIWLSIFAILYLVFNK